MFPQNNYFIFFLPVIFIIRKLSFHSFSFLQEVAPYNSYSFFHRVLRNIPSRRNVLFLLLILIITTINNYYRAVCPNYLSKDVQALDSTGPAERETNTIPADSCFYSTDLTGQEESVKIAYFQVNKIVRSIRQGERKSSLLTTQINKNFFLLLLGSEPTCILMFFSICFMC